MRHKDSFQYLCESLQLCLTGFLFIICSYSSFHTRSYSKVTVLLLLLLPVLQLLQLLWLFLCVLLLLLLLSVHNNIKIQPSQTDCQLQITTAGEKPHIHNV